jgi:hypothetical protein
MKGSKRVNLLKGTNFCDGRFFTLRKNDFQIFKENSKFHKT